MKLTWYKEKHYILQCFSKQLPDSYIHSNISILRLEHRTEKHTGGCESARLNGNRSRKGAKPTRKEPYNEKKCIPVLKRGISIIASSDQWAEWRTRTPTCSAPILSPFQKHLLRKRHACLASVTQWNGFALFDKAKIPSSLKQCSFIQILNKTTMMSKMEQECQKIFSIVADSVHISGQLQVWIWMVELSPFLLISPCVMPANKKHGTMMCEPLHHMLAWNLGH